MINPDIFKLFDKLIKDCITSNHTITLDI